MSGLLAWSGVTSAGTRWYWDDHFTTRERQGLTQWIEHAQKGLIRLFGELPLNFRVHFSRMPHRGEPVPWAETNKGSGARAYFHVDTSYPWEDFHEDWTAPHELTHLLFPYLGEDSRWFAEGIASYLQYQVMYANGTLTWQQTVARIGSRFRRAAGMHRYDGLSIVALSQRPRGKDAFVRYYWGGAAYFINADKRLHEEKDMRLIDVIREYVNCCYRPWGVDARRMMHQFNELSDSRIFTEVYEETVARKAFPDTSEALQWLKDNPPQMADS